MATTTNYSWTTPNDSDPFRNGASAIRTLGSAVDTTLYTALGGAYPGMRLVKKQTVGSGVTSVQVTGAFSATYENYKILYSGGVKSATDPIRLQLGASTTGYFSFLVYGTYGSNTVNGATDNNAALWNWIGGGDTNACWLSVDLLGPQLAKYTRLIGGIHDGTATTGPLTGTHKVATAYTDFTISPASGTLTGGTIYVYGYGAS